MEKSKNQARIKREAVKSRLINLGCRSGDTVAIGDGYVNAREFVVLSSGLAQMKQCPPCNDYYSCPVDEEAYEFAYKALVLGRGHLWLNGKKIV